jgi:hypothetical protein
VSGLRIPASVLSREVVHRGCAGQIELRAFRAGSPPERYFYDVEDLASAAMVVRTRLHTHEWYWAIGSRFDRSSGCIENVHQLAVVFVDLDLKPGETLDDLRARLRAFPIPPALLICSGGGLHCYWLLQAPVDVDHLQESSVRGGRIKIILRRLAHHLSGDLKCADVARILRFPHSFNLKRGTPVRVEIEVFEPENVTTLDGLSALLVADPMPADPPAAVLLPRPSSASVGDVLERGRRYLTVAGPAIQGSGGDSHTFRLACWLTVDLNLSEADAYALLSSWNQTCQPPWTERELMAKVQHARRYARHVPGAALSSPMPQRVSRRSGWSVRKVRVS